MRPAELGKTSWRCSGVQSLRVASRPIASEWARSAASVEAGAVHQRSSPSLHRSNPPPLSAPGRCPRTRRGRAQLDQHLADLLAREFVPGDVPDRRIRPHGEAILIALRSALADFTDGDHLVNEGGKGLADRGVALGLGDLRHLRPPERLDEIYAGKTEPIEMPDESNRVRLRLD